MTKQIKAARANVARFAFGTDEWEAAMVVVRALVETHDAAQPKFIYTSVDGDIFDRR